MSIRKWWATSAGALSTVMLSALAYAQTTDGAAEVTSTTTQTTTTEWYGQWYIWALGVAVFLIIVIALTNRGGSRT